MKHTRAIPRPIEHRHNKHQLYWSQNSDGDLIAHVRLNKTLNHGLRAGSKGLDETKELARFYGCNLTNDRNHHSHIPLHTDEKSASLDFKITIGPCEQHAIMIGSDAVVLSDVIKRRS